MRCEQCQKFVSYDDSTDPEVNNLEVDDAGRISGEVRIVLTCDECSTELKEASFEIDFEPDDASPYGEFLKKHDGKGHELSLEENSFELTSRQESQVKPPGYHVFISGGGKKKDRCSFSVADGDHEKPCGKKETAGVHKIRQVPFRYQKTFYGFHGDVQVTCDGERCEKASIGVDLEDEVQAGGMDELQ
jgi:hypothetical protein